MATVDLNADVGEGLPGTNDVALLGHVSSANIACGGHAGDVETMRATARAAASNAVAIGAHPSFPDREHFGRRELQLAASDVAESVEGQLRALAAVAADLGTRLHHVKPHGALYNMAARDRALATVIARAIAGFDPRLILVGLAGSELVAAAEAAGLQAAHEGFADRAYARDGSLVPRTSSDAVLTDVSAVVNQAVRMVTEGVVTAVTGEPVRLHVDTLCVHGDTPGAVHLAQALRRGLTDAGVRVGPLGASRG